MKTLLVGDRFGKYILESFLSKESEIDVLDSLSLEIMTPRGYNLIIWDKYQPVIKDKGQSTANKNLPKSTRSYQNLPVKNILRKK
jgi:hypothetical protein